MRSRLEDIFFVNKIGSVVSKFFIDNIIADSDKFICLFYYIFTNPVFIYLTSVKHNKFIKK